MRSAVYISILLVAMATSEVMAQNQPQKPPSRRNDTDVSVNVDNSTDTSDNESPESIGECRITSTQYDNLKNILMELTLQLEQLQTTVDNINLGIAPKTISGTLRRQTIAKLPQR